MKTIFSWMVVVVAIGCHDANAQHARIDITAMGIQVGEQVPDVTLGCIYNYVTDSARLSDFKGKLVILDFWATWCTPCVAMMPELDSLQRTFAGRIQILPVTYQRAEEVIPLLEKVGKGRSSLLPKIMEEEALHRLFPHRELPHFVWIGPHGSVIAITNRDEVTRPKVRAVLVAMGLMD